MHMEGNKKLKETELPQEKKCNDNKNIKFSFELAFSLKPN